MHDKESGTYLDDLGYRPNPTTLSLTTKYMFKGRSQTAWMRQACSRHHACRNAP